MMPKMKSNRRRVVKRGGSFAVTSPAVYAAQLGVDEHTVLEFEPWGRELIVRKVREDGGDYKA